MICMMGNPTNGLPIFESCYPFQAGIIHKRTNMIVLKEMIMNKQSILFFLLIYWVEVSAKSSSQKIVNIAQPSWGTTVTASSIYSSQQSAYNLTDNLLKKGNSWLSRDNAPYPQILTFRFEESISLTQTNLYQSTWDWSMYVAQNAAPETNGHCSAFNLPGAQGRDFSFRNGFDPRVDGYLYGWNFQEQWDRAFEIDPELVFVTGWNEFIAGQWLPEHSWTGDPFSFVDQFDWKRSRDIEPNLGWGDKGDVYYLQLVDNVRKFKGMTPPEPVSASKSIKIGKSNQWNNVTPIYNHYKGNTFHRDHVGRNNTYYINTTGRNDIVKAKVARDQQSIYFYVESTEKLTSRNDPNWMLLFIDIDRDKSTGWNGYDFILNRQSPTSKKVIVEKNIGNRWEWQEVKRVPYAVKNNQLEIKLDRETVGMIGTKLDFEFKWNDNMQENGNIMDFYVNGDTAPGGRFNFVYTE